MSFRPGKERSGKIETSTIEAGVVLGKTVTSEEPKRGTLVIDVEITVKGKRHTLHALVDSGADEEFIAQSTVVALGMKGKPPDTFGKAVDGHKISLYGRHQCEIIAEDCKGRQSRESCSMLATDIEGFDAILGASWLWKVDPDISFRRGVWTMRSAAIKRERKKARREGRLVDPLGTVIPRSDMVRVNRIHSVNRLCTDADDEVYVMWYVPSPDLEQTGGILHTNRTGDANTHLRSLAVENDRLPKQYQDYDDVARDPGEQGLPPSALTHHAIDLMPGTTAPYGPIYPLSGKELEALRVYLEEAQTKGWIQKSESAAGAPILFVPKKDGTLRLCVDYRGLNKVTIKNRYPLPLITEILDRLSGAKYFTKLDLRDAYHRIPIKEQDRWKTAFRTRYGQFEYLVMPFGLTNAPATFQAYINESLRGLTDLHCIAYMDDILIYSETEEEHISHVRFVLERLRKFGLFIKLSKCEFHVQEVDFLGFRVGARGVSMDQKRIVAINEWPAPAVHRDIQVFLGFTNFYRGFIQDYSKVVAPMTDLLKGLQKGKKTEPLDWDNKTKAVASFKRLKKLFQTAPLLCHYDPELEIRVETDASGFGLGGVLSQLFPQPEGGPVWKPIAFYSRKFKPEETRYSTGDQEMLAIVHAFQEWRHYLESPTKTVSVITDHEALLKFMDNKVLARKRQTRWAESLAAFNFKIEWRAGKKNPADGLSRRPDYEQPFLTGDEKKDNLLQELIALRMDIPAESYGKSQTGEKASMPPALRGTWIRATSIAVLTRAQSMKKLPAAQSPWNTVSGPLPPQEGVGSPEAPLSAEGRVSIPSYENVEDEASSSDEQKPSPPARDRAERSGQVLDEQGANGENPTPVLPGSDAPYESYGRQELESQIRGLQPLDPFVSQQKWTLYPDSIVNNAAPYNGKWTVDERGLVRMDGKVFIPDDPAIRAEILRVNHDDPWDGGHFGINRTVEMIQRCYWWPQMRARVKDYVQTCDICQRMKVPRHKPFGQLAPLPPPKVPWEGLAMDFIVGLPPSKHRGCVYDAILVVVDRHSKMVRLIPCTQKTTAEQLATLLFDDVFSLFGIPKSIVSDRGSLFTSRYWETLCYLLTIRRKLSTAFHPQTDGQTERLNQVLECYLRCYLNEEQDNWGELLRSAEWAINNSVNSTINAVPFHVAYNFSPQTRHNLDTESGEIGTSRTEWVPESINESASQRARAIEETRAHLHASWEKTQASVKKYYDNRHLDMAFDTGSLVMLSTKNISLRKAMKKLSDKFIGPFEVEKKVGPNAYKLKLPQKYGRLHATFHVSLLQAYHRRPGTDPPDPIEIEGDQEYEIEEILDETGKGKRRRLLCRWKGYSQDHDTWEYIGTLGNAADLVKEFEARKKSQRRQKSDSHTNRTED